MSESDTLESLRRDLAEARTTSDLRRWLESASGLRTEPDSELYDLRVSAFDQLARHTADHPAEAREVLVRDLLPLCLSDDRHSRYAGVLGQWLSDDHAQERETLRDIVIDRLVGALGEPTGINACASLAAVGFRDARVTAALDRLIALRDDELGETALHTRAILGVSQQEQQQLLPELHRRMNWPPSSSVLGTAQRIAGPETLAILRDRWLTLQRLTESAQDFFRTGMLLQVPAAIADRHPGNAELQNDVWQLYRSLLTEMLPTVRGAFLLSGVMGQLCDTPGVIPGYAGFLDNDNQITRVQLHPRLSECIRPRQLPGWDDALSQDVRRRLHNDATGPSRIRGAWSTTGLDCKRDAWQTLLCAGDQTILDLLAPAIDDENNGFAIGEVLSIAANLPVLVLPARVNDLIAARFGTISDQSNERITAQVAAIQVAWSADAAEGFESLLNYVRFYTPGVLLSVVEALADTAAVMAKRGDSSGFERLKERSYDPSASGDQRGAAAAALARLVQAGEVVGLAANGLLSLIRDPMLDSYPRRELLDSLAYLPTASRDTEAVEWVRQVARGEIAPETQPEQEGGRNVWQWISLRVLARLGLLETDQALHCGPLGLIALAEGWDLTRTPSAELAHVLALLYARNPHDYAPAVRTMLQDGDVQSISPLLPVLQSSRPIPATVVDAVVARISQVNEGCVAEPKLFEVLATIDPARLVVEDWPGLPDWLPQARAALANTLGTVPLTENGVGDRSLNRLVQLAGDGQYAVRRSAFRSLAAIAPEGFLNQLCQLWGSARGDEGTDLRKRAAEGVAWCSEGLDPVTDALASDPEPSVRETFARCNAERRDRQWAEAYARIVLVVEEPEGVVRAWRYGRALERVGDDQIAEVLGQRAGERRLPPSVRHWLRSIANRVEKRWDGVTQRWPQPWRWRPTAMERVRGAFRGEGREWPFDGWIWRDAASSASELSGWGGWADNCGVDMPREVEVSLDGYDPARVLIVNAQFPAGQVTFSGQGCFPEPRAS